MAVVLRKIYYILRIILLTAGVLGLFYKFAFAEGVIGQDTVFDINVVTISGNQSFDFFFTIVFFWGMVGMFMSWIMKVVSRS